MQLENMMILIVVIFDKYRTFLDILDISNYRGPAYDYNPSIPLSSGVETTQNNFQTRKKI